MNAVFSSPADRTGVPPADSTMPAQQCATSQPLEQPLVSAGRLSHIRTGRVRYALRFIYWTLRHRSTKHVRWVLAFEGYTWN